MLNYRIRNLITKLKSKGQNTIHTKQSLKQLSKQPKIHTHFFKIKAFMLGITMQLDISTMLTPQVITIICHRMKKYY